MAISRISAHSAQTSSVSITTPTKGDVIIVAAHRDGSNTSPTLATGYYSVADAGNNTNSMRLGYKISDGTETTSGTWTNATSVAVGVYRGMDVNCPIVAWQAGSGSSTTLSFTGMTMHVTDNTSWAVAFAGHRTATNVGTNAPTGMGTRSSATDIAIFDTGGTVTSWSTQTASVNANSGWRTYTFELRAAPLAAPSPDPLVQHVAGAPTEQTGNTWRIYFPNTTLANNLLHLAFSHTTGVSVTSVQDNNANSWTAGPTAIAGNGTTDSRVYYRLGAVATSYVTVVLSGSVSEFNFALSEFYGVATSSAVDGTSTGTTTSTLPIASGSITSTQTGDLFVQYIQDCQQTFWLLNTACLGFAPHPGWVILSANQRSAAAAQYGIQSGSGALNIGLDPLQPDNPDSWNTLTMAFKMNGSGTAPSGMRIIREYTHSTFLNAVEQVQFPTQGNLTWVATTVPNNQDVMSTATDLQSNTYTRKNLDTTAGQLLYAANATASLSKRITVTYADAGYYARFFDVTGADTSPFDAQAFTTQSTGAGADLTLNNFITPSTASGMTLMIIPTGTGPFTFADAPTGVITDTTFYTGESDAGNMNFGDFFGHFKYSSTAAQSWNINTNFPGASDSAPSAFTFKAASASNGKWNNITITAWDGVDISAWNGVSMP